MAWRVKEAPRPPTSLGNAGAVQPFAASFRRTPRENSYSAAPSPDRLPVKPFQPAPNSSRIQDRISPRQLSSSLVNRKSMAYPRCRIRGPACLRSRALAGILIRAGPHRDLMVPRSRSSLTCDLMVTESPTMDGDPVFKALAYRSRRHLLDLLFERDGRTLSELESGLAMTRFGVMKHLRLLEEAGLITTRRVGREKLHYLNPVPIRRIYDRWIDKYTAQRAGALTALKSI